jgi:hypothetical protein
MRNAKTWLLAAVLFGAFAGTGVLMVNSSSRAEPQELKDHWRHHDGHWSYWDTGDKRWYYTDGQNWFFNEGEAWRPYGFDKHFGKEGFERGEYKVPGEGVKVVVPGHKVYHR